MKPTHRTARGVTLFELLVVLVVSSILMALFVVTAQYLMTSSRVSRVKEEHRVLTRALQNYESDFGTAPSTQLGLRALCAPVAYMVQVPADPFSLRQNNRYSYVRLPGESSRWLIVSEGPDCRTDVLNAFGLRQRGGALVGGRTDDRPDTLSLPTEAIETILARLTYDPTNGLVSAGDIITFAH